MDSMNALAGPTTITKQNLNEEYFKRVDSNNPFDNISTDHYFSRFEPRTFADLKKSSKFTKENVLTLSEFLKTMKNQIFETRVSFFWEKVKEFASNAFSTTQTGTSLDANTFNSFLTAMKEFFGFKEGSKSTQFLFKLHQLVSIGGETLVPDNDTAKWVVQYLTVFIPIMAKDLDPKDFEADGQKLWILFLSFFQGMDIPLNKRSKLEQISYQFELFGPKKTPGWQQVAEENISSLDVTDISCTPFSECRLHVYAQMKKELDVRLKKEEDAKSITPHEELKEEHTGSTTFSSSSSTILDDLVFQARALRSLTKFVRTFRGKDELFKYGSMIKTQVLRSILSATSDLENTLKMIDFTVNTHVHPFVAFLKSWADSDPSLYFRKEYLDPFVVHYLLVESDWFEPKFPIDFQKWTVDRASKNFKMYLSLMLSTFRPSPTEAGMLYQLHLYAYPSEIEHAVTIESETKVSLGTLFNRVNEFHYKTRFRFEQTPPTLPDKQYTQSEILSLINLCKKPVHEVLEISRALNNMTNTPPPLPKNSAASNASISVNNATTPMTTTPAPIPTSDPEPLDADTFFNFLISLQTCFNFPGELKVFPFLHQIEQYAFFQEETTKDQLLKMTLLLTRLIPDMAKKLNKRDFTLDRWKLFRSFFQGSSGSASTVDNLSYEYELFGPKGEGNLASIRNQDLALLNVRDIPCTPFSECRFQTYTAMKKELNANKTKDKGEEESSTTPREDSKDNEEEESSTTPGEDSKDNEEDESSTTPREDSKEDSKDNEEEESSTTPREDSKEDSKDNEEEESSTTAAPSLHNLCALLKQVKKETPVFIKKITTDHISTIIKTFPSWDDFKTLNVQASTYLDPFVAILKYWVKETLRDIHINTNYWKWSQDQTKTLFNCLSSGSPSPPPLSSFSPSSESPSPPPLSSFSPSSSMGMSKSKAYHVTQRFSGDNTLTVKISNGEAKDIAFLPFHTVPMVLSFIKPGYAFLTQYGSRQPSTDRLNKGGETFLCFRLCLQNETEATFYMFRILGEENKGRKKTIFMLERELWIHPPDHSYSHDEWSSLLTVSLPTIFTTSYASVLPNAWIRKRQELTLQAISQLAWLPRVSGDVLKEHYDTQNLSTVRQQKEFADSWYKTVSQQRYKSHKGIFKTLGSSTIVHAIAQVPLLMHLYNLSLEEGHYYRTGSRNTPPHECTLSEKMSSLSLCTTKFVQFTKRNIYSKKFVARCLKQKCFEEQNKMLWCLFVEYGDGGLSYSFDSLTLMGGKWNVDNSFSIVVYNVVFLGGAHVLFRRDLEQEIKTTEQDNDEDNDRNEAKPLPPIVLATEITTDSGVDTNLLDALRKYITSTFDPTSSLPDEIDVTQTQLDQVKEQEMYHQQHSIAVHSSPYLRSTLLHAIQKQECAYPYYLPESQIVSKLLSKSMTLKAVVSPLAGSHFFGLFYMAGDTTSSRVEVATDDTNPSVSVYKYTESDRFVIYRRVWTIVMDPVEPKKFLFRLFHRKESGQKALNFRYRPLRSTSSARKFKKQNQQSIHFYATLLHLAGWGQIKKQEQEQEQEAISFGSTSFFTFARTNVEFSNLVVYEVKNVLFERKEYVKAYTDYNSFEELLREAGVTGMTPHMFES